GQPIRPHTVPFLDHHAIGLEELADLQALPTGDVFENRSQNSQRAGAQNGAFGDLRDVLGLGDGNRVSVANVRVQHHVHVRAAIANIHNVVGSNLRACLQLVENENFAV